MVKCFSQIHEAEVNDLPICMLKGTYNQSMDAKGRMSFPAKLREIIGEKFIVTKGIDGCLFVYSMEDFELKAEKIKSLPIAKARALQRSFMGWAVDVEADKQGRILVPQSLREVAALEKEVVVVGVSDRCEIWDRKRWEEFNSAIDDDEMMSALEDVDF